MMARLLEAVRPQARLVLVGDPRPAHLGRRRRGALRPGGRLRGQRRTRPVASLTENFRSDRRHRARSPRRSGWATPTRCSPRSGPRRRRGRVRRDRAAPRAPCAPTGWSATRCAVREAAEAGDAATARRGPRRAPAAVRPPRGTATAYATGTGSSSTGSARSPARDPRSSVVRRPAAAGHRQRLRARRLQRRDRRRRPTSRRAAAGVRSPGRRGLRELRARPARRRRDDARDDHPQEPGQPGRRGDRAAARRRTRGC